MAHSSNSEPRRFWKTRHHGRDRECTSCGGRATFHGGQLSFCAACLERTRQAQLSEWDDLGTGD
jgi:hypothetical protein